MVQVADDFNDGASDTIGDGNWTEAEGDIDNSAANTAISTTVNDNCTAIYDTPMATTTHFVQADHIDMDQTRRCGILARNADSGSPRSNYVGLFDRIDHASGYKLFKDYGAGGQVQLDSAASGSGTKTGKLICNGSALSYEIESSEVCNASDSDRTGLNCGLATYNNLAIWDNWSAEDFVVGGQPPAPNQTQSIIMGSLGAFTFRHPIFTGILTALTKIIKRRMRLMK